MFRSSGRYPISLCVEGNGFKAMTPRDSGLGVFEMWIQGCDRQPKLPLLLSEMRRTDA